MSAGRAVGIYAIFLLVTSKIKLLYPKPGIVWSDEIECKQSRMELRQIGQCL
jgi:hypothetical protein